MPARGPEPISARSLAILVSETAIDLQRARQLDERVAVALRLERVLGRADRRARLGARAARAPCAANSGCVFRPVPVAVPPSGICATCGSALRDARAAEPDLRGVAGELLAERDRHGVHQVRAAGLDDVLERLGLGGERRARAARAPAAAGSSPRRARRGGPRTGRRRWTTAPCSRGRSGARRRRRASRSPRWRSCSTRCPSRSGRRRSGTGRRARRAAISSAAAAIRSASVGVEQPELGVGARGGALDAAEPAHDRRPARARPRRGSSRRPWSSRRPTAARSGPARSCSPPVRSGAER